MKCDELTPIDLECNMGKDSVTGLVNREPWKAYDIDEVDAAIAELKQKLHDVDNKWNEQCKEIAELKAKNRVLQSFYDLHGNVDNYIDQLKAKLESVQATAYADSVDAGMRERRLKRALWIARSEWARSSALSYHLIEDHPNKDVAATYNRKANKWEKVKDKCLKKAEEYK